MPVYACIHRTVSANSPERMVAAACSVQTFVSCKMFQLHCEQRRKIQFVSSWHKVHQYSN